MQLTHLAIVGLGSIGARHLKIIRSLRPNIDITLVSSKANESPGETHNLNTVSTIEEAVDLGIQAAIICTPASLHVSQTKECLESGIHVFVEKPLGVSVDAELLECSKQSTAIVYVGYVLRHHPALNYFRDLIQSSRIGKLVSVFIECRSYLPEWRPNRDYKLSVSALPELGGGVLLELSHELDYMLWLFGEVQTVFARLTPGQELGIEVEEKAELEFMTESGLPISMHLDFVTKSNSRQCIVRGESGLLVLDLTESRVIIKTENGKKTVEVPIPVEMSEVYEMQMNHYFTCIEEGVEPLVGPKEGLMVLDLVEKLRLSNRRVMWVANN